MKLVVCCLDNFMDEFKHTIGVATRKHRLSVEIAIDINIRFIS